jgi:nucleoside-diphosphate-sugar epimerase
VTRALITGGSGFIGTHLARRLETAGYEVDLLDNFSRGQRDRELEELLQRPGLRLIERDLLEPGALDGLDTNYEFIFHFAAIVGVANVARAPDRVLRENVDLLSTALGFASAAGALRRFVFASTSEVYAGTLELGSLTVPTPESAPITVPDMRAPRTSYMLSKVYGEALCLQSGVPVTVVRPHNVYGPRMGLAHVIPELLERAHSTPDSDSLAVYSVDHRRTFCHVSDAVEMIARAAEAPEAADEVLNVGRESPEIRIGDLAEMVLNVVGRELAIEPQPPTPGSPVRRCPDMTKTTGVTGYTAQVDLEQGLADTYGWYRQNVFEAVV